MSQNYETLLVERHGYKESVVSITINNPKKLNALNEKTRAEGAHLLSELAEDDSCHVVIFTGAGDKAFIAGADITEFAEAGAVEQRQVMLKPSLFTAVDRFPKPLIAMINGYCLGGGCELALGCDMRFASDKALIGQPEINLGLIPGGGGTQRMPRLIGEGKAMEMILTGDPVDANTALSIGLVDRVFAADELHAKTLEIADKIARKSPFAIRFAKEAIKSAARSTMDEGLRREIDLFALCFATEDKREGVSAFLEKRKPEFKGK